MADANDLIKRLQADLAVARAALEVVHKDLLVRAETVRGEKVVAIGNGAWMTLCDAIAAARAEGGE